MRDDQHPATANETEGERKMKKLTALRRLLSGKEVRPAGWMMTYLHYDKETNELLNGWDEVESFGIFDTSEEWEEFPDEKEPT